MSYEPDRDPYAGQDGFDSPDPYGVAAAAQKTNVPGIFLVLVGVLNALFGIYFLFNGVVTAVTPAEQLAAAQADAQKVVEKLFGVPKEELEKQKQTPQQQKITGVATSPARIRANTMAGRSRMT